VKACTVLRPVLEYLWGVHHKKVPSTMIGIDRSQDAEEWSSKIHLACILHLINLPVPPPEKFQTKRIRKTAQTVGENSRKKYKQ